MVYESFADLGEDVFLVGEGFIMTSNAVPHKKLSTYGRRVILWAI
tara:strand:- start:31 stop:165 length:135 start_codon:yes stop_codon:yes gene_type:complete